MGILYWFGFIGAWLLFAGPVYQAALELGEQGFSQEEGRAFRDRVDRVLPSPISPWWWLLPPLAYLLSRRRSRAARRGLLQQMSRHELEVFQNYGHKSAGWLLVAVGAVCIAVFHTGELVEHYEWPLAAMIALLIIPFLLSVGFTTFQLRRSSALLAMHDEQSSGARASEVSPAGTAD